MSVFVLLYQQSKETEYLEERDRADYCDDCADEDAHYKSRGGERKRAPEVVRVADGVVVEL